MATSPNITFNDGNQIPQLGYGVWQVEDDVAEKVVVQALDAGYRHVDTAKIYGNEAGVGRALAESDVDENDWFYDEVVYVYENGLMNGVENNQFAPNTATNRAMLATILYRLAGEPAVSGDLPFTDVESGTWYTDAVLWAAQNGIVNGLGENTFAPMNTLTREQLVTMLYRYAEAEGYDVSAAADLSGYPDADKVQTYAQEAMSWAVGAGLLQGRDGGLLAPAGQSTRAELATILSRFLAMEG